MKQTAVEWLQEQLKDGVKYNPLEKNGYSNAEQRLFEQAKEMEEQQSQLYATFCLRCINEKLPVIRFEDWIKLEGDNK